MCILYQKLRFGNPSLTHISTIPRPVQMRQARVMQEHNDILLRYLCGGNSLRISAAHLLTLAHDHGSLHSILGPNNLRQPRSLASRSAGNLRRVSLALSQSHIVSTSLPQWTQMTGRPSATLFMQLRPAPSRPSQDDMSHFPQCGHREYWQACQPATHVMRDKTIHGRLSRLR